MKINLLALKMVRSWVNNDIKKRRKRYPDKNKYRHFLNIPYIDDNSTYHTYDVYLADPSNRKHCCFIDIHGGAYILGHHEDNYPFAYVLLEAGYDVVLLDYSPNNGKRDIKDIFKELEANLNHLKSHLDRYDLSNDKFVMTGDSAGGHLSLFLSILMQEKKLQEGVDLNISDFAPIANVLCCPVYDFAHLGDTSMSKAATKFMLGPKYLDIDYLSKYSPKDIIQYNKIPVFVSTCTRDFIRNESLTLNKEMENKPNYKFVDIKSDDKNVDHVHNIVKIHLKESIEVNKEIIKFVDNLL